DKGKYREASIQFGNAVQVDPRFAQGHYRLAQSFLKLQQWTRAYQELSRTVELEPENYQARIDLANLLIAGHDIKQAQEHTDFLLSKQPNDPQVHEAIANLLSARQDFPDAIKEIQKSISLGPDRWEAYLNLALLQMRTNQMDAAESNLKKSVQLNPQAMNAQLALGGYYQARKLNDELLKANPSDNEALVYRGQIQIRNGHANEATQTLQTALKNDPDSGVAHFHLGLAFDQLGNLARAENEWRDAVRLRPE